MRKTLFLILLNCIACLMMAQPSFSSFLIGNDYIDKGGIIKIGDRNIIIADEWCNSPVGSDCSYILEVEENGEISYLYDIGEMELFERSFVYNGDRLTIVGTDGNNDIKLVQFDSSINFISEATYSINTTANFTWIFGMVEFGDYYVVSTYPLGTGGANYPTLYWFNINDLELAGSYTIEEHETTLREMTVDNDVLRVFHLSSGQNKILSFDSSMNDIEEWQVQEDGNISYLNFEMTNEGNYIFGLHQNKKLLNYTQEGQLNWELNIAAAFGIQQIIFIRQLKQLSNGDFLICGSLTKDSDYYGFIYLLDNNGVEQWKRIYRPQNATWTSHIIDFVETEDGGFLFYGTTRFEPFPSSTNAPDAYWALKTDNNGCVGLDCGEEIVLNVSEEQPNAFKISPNPTNSAVTVQGLENFIDKEYRVFSAAGMLLARGELRGNTVELSQLQSGVYFLEIVVEGKKLLVERVVKSQ